MIVELSKSLPNFPGLANRSRCFTHVLNLVVKSIMRQFDVPKAQENGAMDEAAKELAATLEDEELSSWASVTEGSEDDDDVDGWIDERDDMTEDERNDLIEDVEPVRLMLVKVSLYYTTDSFSLLLR